jgi:hypothetical protein
MESFFDPETATYILVAVLLAPAGWIAVTLLDHWNE